jgi:transposase InsO family protein
MKLANHQPFEIGLARQRGKESLFLGLDHARTKITNWVDDYNQRRPRMKVQWQVSTNWDFSRRDKICAMVRLW